MLDLSSFCRFSRALENANATLDCALMGSHRERAASPHTLYDSEVEPAQQAPRLDKLLAMSSIVNDRARGDCALLTQLLPLACWVSGQPSTSREPATVE